MPPRIGDIDRWIEEGLTRYGRGEVDAALEAWENALTFDPDNAQANSYVDYVRQNYDLLTGAGAGDARTTPTDGELAGLPYPIGDGESADYQIEILSGELPPVSGGADPQAAVDGGGRRGLGDRRRGTSRGTAGDGRGGDQQEADHVAAGEQADRAAHPGAARERPRPREPDVHDRQRSRAARGPPAGRRRRRAGDRDRHLAHDLGRSTAARPGPSAPPPRNMAIELELDADEPPEPEAGLSFDDATREYQKGRPPTRDLDLSAARRASTRTTSTSRS